MRPQVLRAARTGVVAAAAAGVVLAATHVDGALALGATQPDTTAPASTSTPVQSSSLLCPGPELRGVPGLDDLPVGATVAATTAPLRAMTGTEPTGTDGTVSLGVMPKGTLGKAATQRATLVSATTSDAHGVEVRGTTSLAPGLAAVQSWLVPSGDQRALVSAPCGQAGSDFWLLAGGGDPGRQERLVLTNPGGNPVSVDVTLHGPDGPVTSGAGEGLVVPAHGRTAFLLDSISADVASPAVHVVAHGGVVSAVVNDLWLDGTRSAGSDDAVPSSPPSRDQVVPAVVVSGAATLRVVVPGSEETVVQARMLTSKGPRALPKGGVVRVAGGSVHDIDLTGLPAGTVSLQVRADHPVAAAAVVSRTSGTGPGDFAWTASTPPITGVAGMPLTAPGGSLPFVRLLGLTSSGDKAGVEVVTVDATGTVASKRQDLPADSVSTVDVTGATAVWVHRLSGSGAVRAGVTTTVEQKGVGSLITATGLRDSLLHSTAVAVRQAPQP